MATLELQKLYITVDLLPMIINTCNPRFVSHEVNYEFSFSRRTKLANPAFESSSYLSRSRRTHSTFQSSGSFSFCLLMDAEIRFHKVFFPLKVKELGLRFVFYSFTLLILVYSVFTLKNIRTTDCSELVGWLWCKHQALCLISSVEKVTNIFKHETFSCTPEFFLRFYLFSIKLEADKVFNLSDMVIPLFQISLVYILLDELRNPLCGFPLVKSALSDYITLWGHLLMKAIIYLHLAADTILVIVFLADGTYKPIDEAGSEWGLQVLIKRSSLNGFLQVFDLQSSFLSSSSSSFSVSAIIVCIQTSRILYVDLYYHSFIQALK